VGRYCEDSGDANQFKIASIPLSHEAARLPVERQGNNNRGM